MHPMLTIAIRAARSAGDLITRSSDRIGRLLINPKSRNNQAGDIDLRAENEIINIIRKAYPDHSILTKEGGKYEGNDYIWIIDPLDSTANFIHGFPQYAISIALKNKNKFEVAVVFDPLRDELFTASRGGGAMLNNRRIRVTNQIYLQDSLLGTSFPSEGQQRIDAYLEMFRLLLSKSAEIRRVGATSLDLAYLAAGRLDGFWGIGLREWDMAAGILLLKEAGGVVTDFSFNDDYVSSGNMIAANPKMHQLIFQLLEPHMTEGQKSL